MQVKSIFYQSSTVAVLLEEKVRQWAIDRDEIYVYTGPIYDAEEVGINEVVVPTHIFKVVYDPKAVEAIAFIMPNQPLKPEDTTQYVTTIDEIEQKTGLDFLSKLSSAVQDAVDKESAGGR